jgi:hypothetical protein
LPPSPPRRPLRAAARIPGLPQIKTERLRALADAALAGDLDATAIAAELAFLALHPGDK